MMNPPASTIARAAVRVLAVWTADSLSGCMVGPDYVRPGTDVPAAYKELPPNKPAEPRDTAPRGNWWEVFGDPELNALEAQVAQANQTLKQAEANYRVAHAAIRVAQAGLYPGVTGSAAATRAGGGGNSRSATGNLYTASLDASWELDLWGRIRRGVEASEATAQASAADVANTQLSLEAELAQDYLLLRVADAEKRVLEATVTAYTDNYNLTQNRYKAGVAARADVVQAEAQLLAAKVQLIDLNVSRANFEHAIAVLIGKPPSELSILPKEGTPMLPEIPVGVPSELLERRPDIASAERQMAAANANIGVATAAIYPSLTLSATGGFVGTSFANWISLPNRFWSIGATLAGTVFDAGAKFALRDEAIAQYDANVAGYRQTVLSAFQDVEDNLSTLRILDQEAGVQDQALRAARESVVLTTNQYKAGIVAYLNVVTVQAVALQSELNQVQLRGRRFSASIALVKALGGGFDATSLAATR